MAEDERSWSRVGGGVEAFRSWLWGAGVDHAAMGDPLVAAALVEVWTRRGRPSHFHAPRGGPTPGVDEDGVDEGLMGGLRPE